MKISSFCLFSALSSAPAMAQVAAPNLAPLRAPKMATVTPFITGLKEPQGMAIDPFGTLYLCDYGAGEILRFSSQGTLLGKFATALRGPSQIVLDKLPNSKFPPREDRYEVVANVTECGANRVVKVARDGTIMVQGNEVAAPVGLVKMGFEKITIISQTTSEVLRWVPPYSYINGRSGNDWSGFGEMGRWETIYNSPSNNPMRYGLRGIISDNGAYFVSDEVGHRILMLTDGGRIATFATGISKPSGLVIGPDKLLYVANESDGGQLIRISNDSQKTVVAEKLGRPNSILFLDAKTALVSNRDGNIWKIVLP